jgi:divalent metal cation (Fe/Co/Zn/Cd) transporter
VGTAMIGVLLVVIAVVLAIEMKSLLLGESARGEDVRRIEAALVGDGVDRVIHMRTMHLGPDELLVGAKVAVGSTDSAAEVARAIDAAERRVRAAVPIARVIYLEPDLDRGPVESGPVAAAGAAGAAGTAAADAGRHDGGA